MNKNGDEKWFAQDRPWQGAFPVRAKGWAALALFLVAYVATEIFFISLLEPFTPLDYRLAFLSCLAALVLMVGFYLFARTKTDRRWLPRDTRQ